MRRSYEDPAGTWETNVTGTVHVLEAVRAAAPEAAVVVVTSDKCYANDGSGRPFREGDPLGGNDPYSASKAAQELVAASHRGAYGLRIATARAGNVIGGGDWGADRLVPDFFRAAAAGEPLVVRNPESTRPWQHVLGPAERLPPARPAPRQRRRRRRGVELRPHRGRGAPRRVAGGAPARGVAAADRGGGRPGRRRPRGCGAAARLRAGRARRWAGARRATSRPGSRTRCAGTTRWRGARTPAPSRSRSSAADGHRRPSGCSAAAARAANARAAARSPTAGVKVPSGPR